MSDVSLSQEEKDWIASALGVLIGVSFVLGGDPDIDEVVNSFPFDAKSWESSDE